MLKYLEIRDEDYRASIARLGDADHARRSMSMSVHGMALADTILGRLPEIATWIADRGTRAVLTADGYRAREHKAADYPLLLAELGLFNVDVFDNGSILAGLASLIDTCASAKPTSYCY